MRESRIWKRKEVWQKEVSEARLLRTVALESLWAAALFTEERI
ncbi:hypothetical protein KTH_56360 [Thermosporothrix hazakensis]|nr:hypothetical protein KTH_11840 [Thermosporothrix hazakensis]GCE50767.1 hypothetical protein KTH_56360 [Thermosporothrix hazakensis]